MLQQEYKDGSIYSIPKITKQHLKGVKNGFFDIYNTITGDIHTKHGIVNYDTARRTNARKSIKF